MAHVNLDPQGFDPYKNFKFRVGWNANEYVAGVRSVSALVYRTARFGRGEGGSNRASSVRAKYEPIVLERDAAKLSALNERESSAF